MRCYQERKEESMRKSLAKLSMRTAVASLVLFGSLSLPANVFAQQDPPIIVGGGGAPQSNAAPEGSPITVGGGGGASVTGESTTNVGGGGVLSLLMELAVLIQ